MPRRAIVLLRLRGFNQRAPPPSSTQPPMISTAEPTCTSRVRPITEADAIDIWIARWLRVRRRDLCKRYRCDPRRLYEIWEGSRFPGAQAKARALFAERHPGIVDRIDFGRHRRLARAIDPNQLALFD
jgi:hypothetical protein